jgi:hypothetical protein
MAQNIPRSTDLARSVRHQNARAINPRPVLHSTHRLDPCEKVSALLRQQASTLLLIKKQDCAASKALPLGCLDCFKSIQPAERRSVLTFELGIQPPVEQDQEAESVCLEEGTLA